MAKNFRSVVLSTLSALIQHHSIVPYKQTLQVGPPPAIQDTDLFLKGLEEEKDKCHWCQIRTFSTHKEYPIAIVNDVDNASIPSEFRFIEHSILRDGVESADEDFHAGCECAADRDCQRRGCHCLQDMAVEDEESPGGKICVYHGTGTRKECLRGAVLDSRNPIYECHVGCACSEDCKNRVVERGRKVPLQIFRTDNGRGWGRSPFARRIVTQILSNMLKFIHT